MASGILQSEQDIKYEPDEALAQEIQKPTKYPTFMVLSEIQLREQAKKGKPQGQSMNQPTIKEQILSGGIAGGQQPPQRPQGQPQQMPMGQPPQGMPPQGMPPQQFYRGGIVGYSGGGVVGYQSGSTVQGANSNQQRLSGHARRQQTQYPPPRFNMPNSNPIGGFVDFARRLNNQPDARIRDFLKNNPGATTQQALEALGIDPSEVTGMHQGSPQSTYEPQNYLTPPMPQEDSLLRINRPYQPPMEDIQSGIYPQQQAPQNQEAAQTAQNPYAGMESYYDGLPSNPMAGQIAENNRMTELLANSNAQSYQDLIDSLQASNLPEEIRNQGQIKQDAFNQYAQQDRDAAIAAGATSKEEQENYIKASQAQALNQSLMKIGAGIANNDRDLGLGDASEMVYGIQQDSRGFVNDSKIRSKSEQDQLSTRARAAEMEAIEAASNATIESIKADLVKQGSISEAEINRTEELMRASDKKLLNAGLGQEAVMQMLDKRYNVLKDSRDYDLQVARNEASEQQSIAAGIRSYSSLVSQTMEVLSTDTKYLGVPKEELIQKAIDLNSYMLDFLVPKELQDGIIKSMTGENSSQTQGSTATPSYDFSAAERYANN